MICKRMIWTGGHNGISEGMFRAFIASIALTVLDYKGEIPAITWAQSRDGEVTFGTALFKDASFVIALDATIVTLVGLVRTAPFSAMHDAVRSGLNLKNVNDKQPLLAEISDVVVKTPLRV